MRRPAATISFQQVQVAATVGLQASYIFVAVRSDLPFVVEVLIPVRFAVSVTIVQPRDLVATNDVDSAVHNLQTKGLEQTRGKTFPAQTLELFVDSRNQPNIAM